MKKFYCFIFCIFIFRAIAGIDEHKIQQISDTINADVDIFISNIKSIIDQESNINQDMPYIAKNNEEMLYKAKNVPDHILYDILNAIQDINEGNNNPDEAMERVRSGIANLINARKKIINARKKIINARKNLDHNYIESKAIYYDAQIDLILNFVLFNAKAKAKIANKAADIAFNAAANSSKSSIDDDSLLKSQILIKIAANAKTKYASIAERMLDISCLLIESANEKVYASIAERMLDISYLLIESANEKVVTATKGLLIPQDYDSIITEATKKLARVLSASKSSDPYIDSAPFIEKISHNKDSVYIQKIPDAIKYAIYINNAKQNHNSTSTMLENMLLKLKNDKFLSNIIEAYENIDKVYDNIDKAYIALNKAFFDTQTLTNDKAINQAWTNAKSAIDDMTSAEYEFSKWFKNMITLIIGNNNIIEHIDKFNNLIAMIFSAIADDPNSPNIAILSNKTKIQLIKLINSMIQLIQSNNNSMTSDFITARINMLRNNLLFRIKIEYEAASLAYDIANKIKSDTQTFNQATDLMIILLGTATKNIKKAEVLLEIMGSMNDTLSKSDIKINNNNDIYAEKIQALSRDISTKSRDIKEIEIPMISSI